MNRVADYTWRVMNFLDRKLLGRCRNILSRITSKRIITGYGNSELLEAVVLKNKLRIKALESSKVISGREFQAIALVNYVYIGKPLTVVDFGGGAASHFYMCEKFIPEKIATWVVIETPGMVAGSEREFQHPKLCFVDDLRKVNLEIEKPDVVFSSSALQYTPDPLKAIRDLLALDPRTFIVTRTPLTELEEPVRGEQKSSLSSNGPGPLPEGIQNTDVFYSIVIPPRKSVESLMSKNYRIKLNISEGLTHFQNVGKFDCFTYIATRDGNV